MATYDSMSNSFENMVINHIFRSASTSGSLCYIALYSNNPTDFDIGTEIAGNNYARLGVSGSWTTTDCSAVYTGSGTFPIATGSWLWVTHWGIRNGPQAGANSGSLLFYGQFSASRYISQGDNLKAMPGDFSVLLDGGTWSPYLCSKLLNHYLNNINFATPGSGVYAALYTLLDSGSIELGGSIGYSRIPIGGTANWVSPTSGSTYNSVPFVFTTNAPLDWGMVYGLSAYTAGSGGNKLFSNPFYEGVEAVPKGTGFQFDANMFKVHAS